MFAMFFNFITTPHLDKNHLCTSTLLDYLPTLYTESSVNLLKLK